MLAQHTARIYSQLGALYRASPRNRSTVFPHDFAPYSFDQASQEFDDPLSFHSPTTAVRNRDSSLLSSGNHKK